jgi:hypothetical protein
MIEFRIRNRWLAILLSFLGLVTSGCDSSSTTDSSGTSSSESFRLFGVLSSHVYQINTDSLAFTSLGTISYSGDIASQITLSRTKNVIYLVSCTQSSTSPVWLTRFDLSSNQTLDSRNLDVAACPDSVNGMTSAAKILLNFHSGTTHNYYPVDVDSASVGSSVSFNSFYATLSPFLVSASSDIQYVVGQASSSSQGQNLYSAGSQTTSVSLDQQLQLAGFTNSSTLVGWLFSGTDLSLYEIAISSGATTLLKTWTVTSGLSMVDAVYDAKNKILYSIMKNSSTQYYLSSFAVTSGATVQNALSSDYVGIQFVRDNTIGQ